MTEKKKKRCILRDLYYGILAPADKGPLTNPELRAAMDTVAGGEDQIEQLLEGEVKEQFQGLCDSYAELTKLTGEDRFIDGFKLAMRIACESLFEDG